MSTAATATFAAVMATIGGSSTGAPLTIVSGLGRAASAARAVEGHLNDALGDISAAERRIVSEEASLHAELRRG